MNQPARPYTQEGQPSSGYAQGSDTSRDAEPYRAGVQDDVLTLLGIAGQRGLTWKEAAVALRKVFPEKHPEVHHGTVSGSLSSLHKDGQVDRLTERRRRCLVYVLPRYVNGRETRPQGRQRTCPHCGEEL